MADDKTKADAQRTVDAAKATAADLASGEDPKQAEKDRTEAAKAEEKRAKDTQEINRQRVIEDAEANKRNAEAEVDKADRLVGAAKGQPEKARGKLSDEQEKQIDHGKAPIAPGPEEPVPFKAAEEAKENRGRGLGG